VAFFSLLFLLLAVVVTVVMMMVMVMVMAIVMDPEMMMKKQRMLLDSCSYFSAPGDENQGDGSQRRQKQKRKLAVIITLPLHSYRILSGLSRLPAIYHTAGLFGWRSRVVERADGSTNSYLQLVGRGASSSSSSHKHNIYSSSAAISPSTNRNTFFAAYFS
jgi:hypothetical protein